MIFQCHDQNTKPCLRQTAPQQPRDIFLSVQDGRSRVVDVASTGALKPYYPYSVEAKWDQGGINALSASRLLLNFYWVGIDSAGSIRIHHLHSTSIDILWSNRLTLDFVLSPVLQLKSWFPRWRAFTSRYFTRCWNLLYNRTWVVARLEALEKALASSLSRFFGLVRWAKHGKTDLHPISWAIFRPQGLKNSIESPQIWGCKNEKWKISYVPKSPSSWFFWPSTLGHPSTDDA